MARTQKTKASTQTPPATSQSLDGATPTQRTGGPTHEQIAERAYQIWQARGADHGRHQEDWVQAEHELRNGPQ